MAQQTYRANIFSPAFPFLSEQFGRSVIIGQLDHIEKTSSTDSSGQEKTSKFGTPQMYYCHNVMPSTAGLQSISYKQLIAYTVDASLFKGIISLRDAQDRVAYLGFTESGNFYVSLSPFTTWVYKTALVDLTNKIITRAYVQGTTYIYISNVGCYKYDFTTNNLVLVTLTGLSAVDVIGITSLSGYLIAWTTDTAGWSAIANPTDFVPSITTGAGAGAVEGITGALKICTAAHAGLLAYSTGNVVAVTYTGNSQFPFSFRALPSSGGIKDINHIDYDSLAGQQYGYTSSGFQVFDIQKAQSVLPELTDFIAGSEFEDCEVTTGVFTKTDLTVSMKKAIRLIANRYLIISYGITSLTHAIVYDAQLKRFGKLKITHVQVIDLFLGAESTDIPRNSIGFLKSDGQVVSLNFDNYTAASDTVALFGKYQLVRSRVLQLDGIEFENIKAGSNFMVRVIPALDGKNANSPQILTASTTLGLYKKYDSKAVGKNVSIMLTGSFSLNSFILNFHAHGKR